jgi:hypothetical protein
MSIRGEIITLIVIIVTRSMAMGGTVQLMLIVIREEVKTLVIPLELLHSLRGRVVVVFILLRRRAIIRMVMAEAVIRISVATVIIILIIILIAIEVMATVVDIIVDIIVGVVTAFRLRTVL